MLERNICGWVGAAVYGAWKSSHLAPAHFIAPERKRMDAIALQIIWLEILILSPLKETKETQVKKLPSRVVYYQLNGHTKYDLFSVLQFSTWFFLSTASKALVPY